MSSEKKYTTKQFTVTVERNDGYKPLKCVRIYANCGNVSFMYQGRLLLGAVSGTESTNELLKAARVEAKKKLTFYREKAQAVLDIRL